jgi:hypothetical protein
MKRCCFKIVLSALLIVITGWRVQVQDNEFTHAVRTIMRDAPDEFRDIKGKERSNSMFAVVWDCGVPVPGTIASRFVFSKGLYYEGALVQTGDTAMVRKVYLEYAAKLDTFLLPMKYERSDFENFNPGLSTFPKITYLPEHSGKSKERPPHLALEVTADKELKTYTVVLFIYQH